MEGNGIWSLIGFVAVGYIVWKYFDKRNKPPRLKALNGGRASGQFQTTSKGPEPGFQGQFPQLVALTWPGAGRCGC